MSVLETPRRTRVALVAGIISPKKVYAFSSIGDFSIPKSIKCAHSATKIRIQTHVLLLMFTRPAHGYPEKLQAKTTKVQNPA